MPQYSIAIHEDADDLLEGPVDFSNGNAVIISGQPGLNIRIYKFFLVAAGTTTLTFQDGATPLSSTMISPPDGLVFDFDTKPWFTLSTGNDFVITASPAVQISGRIYFSDGGAAGGLVGPTIGYVTEDGLIFYAAEDGITIYVPEP